MVVVEDGGSDDEGVGYFCTEGGVGAAGPCVEHLGDAVVGDEVVGDEGGGFGADAIRSSGAVFAGSGNKEVVALIVGANDGLGGKELGLQGV